MNKAPLERVLEFTTQAAIAELFEISPAAVNQWRINGIPANRIIALEKHVRKKVTRHEMNAELYPVR